MKTKTILVVLGILLPLLYLKGQRLRPLNVGDTVPDIVFGHVLNTDRPSIRLSDLRGKLVIIDFWSAFCTPCIELFGHLMDLKKQFGDRIEIILFNTKNRDDRKKILDVLANYGRRHGTKVDLPVAYDSRQMDSLAVFRLIPHEIWISPQGTVQAITSSKELTYENIANVLAGVPVKLRTKRDVMARQFANIGPYGVQADSIFSQSTFSGYVDGLSTNSGILFKDATPIGNYRNNNLLINLVKFAYNDSLSRVGFRYVVESGEPEKYREHYDDAGFYAHAVCYASVSIPFHPRDIVPNLKADLKRTFGIEVFLGDRLLDCLLLRYSGNRRNPIVQTDIKDGLVKACPLMTLDSITKILGNNLGIPLVQESSPQPFTAYLPTDLKDRDRLYRCLEASGITVVKTKRTLPVCVITDRTWNNKTNNTTAKQ